MSVLHKNKVIRLDDTTNIIANSSEFEIDNEFENYYPNQIDGESEIQYRLFINFLEERNFNKLSDMIKINFNKNVSRRQLFNIANKYNWRERALKFDKEINFSLMQGAANRVKKMKMEQLDLLINVLDRVNISMKTFNNQILTDLDVFHQVIDFEDDAKIKRMMSTMKIFKDFVYVSSKLQNMIMESGVEDFDILDYLKDFEETEKDNFEDEDLDFDLDMENDLEVEEKDIEKKVTSENDFIMKANFEKNPTRLLCNRTPHKIGRLEDESSTEAATPLVEGEFEKKMQKIVQKSAILREKLAIENEYRDRK